MDTRVPDSFTIDSYPTEAVSRLHYERTAYDRWYRSKASRLSRPFYYHHQPQNERAFVRSLIAKHDLVPGSTVLDIGCGNGLYANAFAREGLRVTAVDLSGAAIDHARLTHGDHVEWITGDAFTLPRHEAFDAAFCHFFTFFNAADDPAQLQEHGRRLMRYLRAKGRLFFIWHTDLTAIRLQGKGRFGIMNYTIKQLEGLFADFKTSSYAIDGMARLTYYLGRFAYHKYITRLTCAAVYLAASDWHRARVIVTVQK